VTSLKSKVLITPFEKFCSRLTVLWRYINIVLLLFIICEEKCELGCLGNSIFCNFADCFEEFISSKKYPLEGRVTFASLPPAAESNNCSSLNGLRDRSVLRSSVEIAIKHFG